MLTFLTNLQPIQLILLVVGFMILLPSVGPFLKDASEKLKKLWVSKKTQPTENRLTNLVFQWETLCKECADLGLHEALAQLEEVFPLLGKARTKPKSAPQISENTD